MALVAKWLDPRTPRSPEELLELCHATDRRVTLGDVQRAILALEIRGEARPRLLGGEPVYPYQRPLPPAPVLR